MLERLQGQDDAIESKEGKTKGKRHRKRSNSLDGHGDSDGDVIGDDVNDDDGNTGKRDPFSSLALERGVTVIYCTTRPQTESLANYLSRLSWKAPADDQYGMSVSQGLSSSSLSSALLPSTSTSSSSPIVTKRLRVAAYHAGLDDSTRDRVHRQFQADELDVLVATSAFGMGIDKPDIRRVIHWGLPTSMEAYYQQTGRYIQHITVVLAVSSSLTSLRYPPQLVFLTSLFASLPNISSDIGRAGRDNGWSECLLYYNNEDVNKTKQLITASAGSMGTTGTGGPGVDRVNQQLTLLNKLLVYVMDDTTCRRLQILR